MMLQSALCEYSFIVGRCPLHDCACDDYDPIDRQIAAMSSASGATTLGNFFLVGTLVSIPRVKIIDLDFNSCTCQWRTVSPLVKGCLDSSDFL